MMMSAAEIEDGALVAVREKKKERDLGQLLWTERSSATAMRLMADGKVA